MTKIGIVAHQSRTGKAHNLFHEIEADRIFFDDGTLGCEGNHRTAWAWLASVADDDDQLVVLEDDALPCNDFREQLDAALAKAPVDVVSLYLGRSRPVQWQNFVKQAVWQADHDDACWIIGNATLHAVGIAIRGPDLVESMLNRTSQYNRPIDERITMWCRQFGHDVGYCWPSLVDHDDDLPTTVVHRDGKRREPGRVAWKVGTRDRWTPRAVRLCP